MDRRSDRAEGGAGDRTGQRDNHPVDVADRAAVCDTDTARNTVSVGLDTDTASVRLDTGTVDHTDAASVGLDTDAVTIRCYTESDTDEDSHTDRLAYTDTDSGILRTPVSRCDKRL